MYIRDLKNTKGHISGLTCGEWHPRTKDTILTSSEDGSLRIWDVNDFKTQKQVRYCFGSCLKICFCIILVSVVLHNYATSKMVLVLCRICKCFM